MFTKIRSRHRRRRRRRRAGSRLAREGAAGPGLDWPGTAPPGRALRLYKKSSSDRRLKYLRARGGRGASRSPCALPARLHCRALRSRSSPRRGRGRDLSRAPGPGLDHRGTLPPPGLASTGPGRHRRAGPRLARDCVHGVHSVLIASVHRNYKKCAQCARCALKAIVLTLLPLGAHCAHYRS